MDIKSMILESIEDELNSLSEGCDCDGKCECDDEDDEDVVKESNDDADDEDDEDDADEDDELEESVSLDKLKIDGKAVKLSPKQKSSLEGLFAEVSSKEREELFKEISKSQDSLNRVVKYAETIL